MDVLMQRLNEKVVVGLVGGSDISKIDEQMSGVDQAVLCRYKYVFCENGLVAYKDGELLSKQSMVTYLGEEKTQRFINFALKCMCEITLPCKRGTFIEFRSGLINLCVVGRSCTQAERHQFVAYDKENKVREGLVAAFKKEFPDGDLCFVIGSQISIDIFPRGWDKTSCLKHVENDGFNTIHFFGDKTAPGGNDHELFADERTIGHTVTGPEDTKAQLEKIFFRD